MLPREPLRQWVLSVPLPLRYLFATDPAAMGAALGIAHRAITVHLVRKAGLTTAWARTGAVTLIQRFGCALKLKILPPAGARWGVRGHSGIVALPPGAGTEAD